MDISLLSVAAITLGIKELAGIIFCYCDVETSIMLLQCTKSLNKHKHNEYLWHIKINKEFGVARFKPVYLTFFQQYISLGSQFDVTSATKSGRCDQLRILRRRSGLSYYNIVNLAIEHDQVEVIQYIEEHERYVALSECFLTTMKIGPKTAIYYAAKVFLASNNTYITIHLDILKGLFIHNGLPQDFEQLMKTAGNEKAALWYREEVRYRHLSMEALRVRIATIEQK